VRTDSSSEQRATSDEFDGCSVADAEAVELDLRGKRRRRWPFSPPLSSHSLLLSDGGPHSLHCCSNLGGPSHSHPLSPVGAVSPLHRLRKLDPVVSSLHPSTPYDVTAYTDDSRGEDTAAAAEDGISHSHPAAAAIVKQRQSVLDRLKALT